MSRVNCPLCHHALDAGELVMVCGPCHKSLGGGLAVNATGEFRVPSSAELESAGVAGEQVGRDSHPELGPTGHCAWCAKLEHEVKKLLGRNHTALCNECISLCADIMEAELGADWR